METVTTGLIPKESLEKLHELITKQEKISAILVVKSKKSGIDFTYRISSSESVVYGYSIFIGIETSYMEFQSCAVAKPNGSANLFKKHANTDSPCMLGAQFILDKLVKGSIDNLIEVSEIHHTGSCIKCNRELTDLTSIELGIGPVCRNI